jgi:hypothetical protein
MCEIKEFQLPNQASVRNFREIHEIREVRRIGGLIEFDGAAKSKCRGMVSRVAQVRHRTVLFGVQ